MESTNRYRLLIIFAALCFCLTVCFANAEVRSVTGATAGPQGSSMHANFLAPLDQPLLATAAYVQSQPVDPPVISMQVVNQLTRNAHPAHGFWHRISLAHQKPGLVIGHPLSNSGNDATDAPRAENIEGAESNLYRPSDQTE